MTIDDVSGWRRKLGLEFQLNVPNDTMIITATSAGIGTWPTHGPSTASRNNRKAPAVKVDKRPRPPAVTLITDCTIIDHPPMPPMTPATILHPPSPAHSRCFSPTTPETRR